MNHIPNINSITDMNKTLDVHTCQATLYITHNLKERSTTVH